MSEADREHWDRRYRARADAPLPPPDPLLLQFAPPAPGPEARALDLAGGRGQNGLWLATQGYAVDVMDISRAALERGYAEAGARRLRRMNFFLTDLDAAALEPDTYALVCVFRFLSRALFPLIREAVRPGGRVIYQTYTLARLERMPDANPDFLLRPGELEAAFADWAIVHRDEVRDVAQVVAVKPVDAAG